MWQTLPHFPDGKYSTLHLPVQTSFKNKNGTKLHEKKKALASVILRNKQKIYIYGDSCAVHCNTLSTKFSGMKKMVGTIS